MIREKKPKVADITKLRKILDDPSDPIIKSQLSHDDKSLESIRRRLAGDTSKTRQRTENILLKFDSLEPKVTLRTKHTVNQRIITAPPASEPSTTLPEFTLISTPAPPTQAPSLKEISFSSEELYEVEKVKVIIPEFLEVTPKKTSKKPTETKTTSEPKETHTFNQNLPEWQPVEEPPAQEPATQEPPLRQEKIPAENLPEFTQIDPLPPSTSNEKTHELYLRLSQEKIKEPSMSMQPSSVQEPPLQGPSKKQLRETKKAEKLKAKEEKRVQKLEIKKLKKEEKEKVKEEKKRAKEQQKTQVQPTQSSMPPEPETPVEAPHIPVDVNLFSGIQSIDENIAEILYKNGFFSIENLKDATIDDLVQIRGIKRKLAKQIKKEVEQKTMSPPEFEFVPKKKKSIVKKQKEEPENITEWESYDADEETKKPLPPPPRRIKNSSSTNKKNTKQKKRKNR